VEPILPPAAEAGHAELQAGGDKLDRAMLQGVVHDGLIFLHGDRAGGVYDDAAVLRVSVNTWEKQVLSATGLKRVGRHSEYAIHTAWRCVRRGPWGFK
jgi:hypothetical protein